MPTWRPFYSFLGCPGLYSKTPIPIEPVYRRLQSKDRQRYTAPVIQLWDIRQSKTPRGGMVFSLISKAKENLDILNYNEL